MSEPPIRIVHFLRRPRPGIFSIERVFEDVRAALPGDCAVEIVACRHPSKGLVRRLADMWRARGARRDVNHVTGDVHFLTLLLERRRTVLTIHDLNMLNRLTGLRRRIYRLVWCRWPVRRAQMVVAVSQATRREILEATGCDPAKVRVIPDCVSPEFRRSPKPFCAAKPRILQVGTGWNKNLERVAQALAGLDCRLVIVGAVSDGQRTALDRFAIEHEVHVGLSREALLAEYEAADLVVFASLYEGFGLPIVEANAVGRPVVAGNVAAMPETAGGAACLVDPYDVGAIRAGIRRIIDDINYRECLIDAGFRNARRFTPSAIAPLYADLYRRLGRG